MEPQECIDILLPPTSSEMEEEHSPMRLSRCDKVEHDIDFTMDDPSTMTFSRRAALHLMQRFEWYNPQLGNTYGKFDEPVEKGVHRGETHVPTYIKMDDNINSVRSFNNSMHLTPIQRERPSLEKAWGYFEHVTLARYLDHKTARGKAYVKANADSNHGLVRQLRRRVRRLIRGDEELMDLAQPGENRYPTKLYSPMWTPASQMGDFGLGVGLYFTALRSLTMLALLAGLVNIPNIIYFAGNEYSNGQEDVELSLKGSAVCTLQEFVPCPDCTLNDFENDPHRFATATSFYGVELNFVVKNFCDGAKLSLGLVNYFTLLVLIVGMALINRHLRQQEIKMDEDEQTAQDYSIVISNPPPDATDPDEWKRFFDTNFGPGVHVTCCTVGKDNNRLVRALVRRREILLKLKWALPPGASLSASSLDSVAVALEPESSMFDKLKAMVFPDVLELIYQLRKVNDSIHKLSTVNFRATRVYVTFETEAAQRKVLELLSVGGKAIKRKDVMKVEDEAHLFRSTLVLNVKEADEPSTVRWHDLSDRFWDKFFKMLLTTYACACSMALVAFIIKLCRNKSATFAAYAIAFFNTVFPEFAKLLVSYESHASEGRRETSLYVKIAAFRWFNTAIIVYWITPFTSTLSSGSDNILDGVFEIFLAEIIYCNLIKLMDPMGIVNRHYLAPRAVSQEEMNSYMRGGEWQLAERYTSMTKLVFFTFWYCSIYPGGFFLCALALFLNYFSDRFNLMRTWMQPPKLGPHISSFSRRYFFTMAISAMSLASSYSWAGFPYDNLCEKDTLEGHDDDNIDDNVFGNYVGTWDAVIADGSGSVEVTVSEGDTSYKFCQQSLYWYGKGFNFPAIPFWQTEGEKWMTEEQEQLTAFYGWTSFILVVLVCMWILRRAIPTLFYRANYQVCGEDQGIPFSSVVSISSYVPQVKSNIFPYPLLAVNTHDIDEELYEWKDPEKPYSYYDITRDASQLLKDRMMPEEEIQSLFSRIKHWPPPPPERPGREK